MNENEIIRKALIQWEKDNYVSIDDKDQKTINGLITKYTALTLGIVNTQTVNKTVEKVNPPYLTETEVETILLDEAEEKRMEEKNYNDERNEWKRLANVK